MKKNNTTTATTTTTTTTTTTATPVKVTPVKKTAIKLPAITGDSTRYMVTEVKSLTATLSDRFINAFDGVTIAIYIPDLCSGDLKVKSIPTDLGKVADLTEYTRMVTVYAYSAIKGDLDRVYKARSETLKKAIDDPATPADDVQTARSMQAVIDARYKDAVTACEAVTTRKAYPVRDIPDCVRLQVFAWVGVVRYADLPVDLRKECEKVACEVEKAVKLAGGRKDSDERHTVNYKAVREATTAACALTWGESKVTENYTFRCNHALAVDVFRKCNDQSEVAPVIVKALTERLRAILKESTPGQLKTDPGEKTPTHGKKAPTPGKPDPDKK